MSEDMPACHNASRVTTVWARTTYTTLPSTSHMGGLQLQIDGGYEATHLDLLAS
jgi:hypothetical protein